jgi:hypothetical protein
MLSLGTDRTGEKKEDNEKFARRNFIFQYSLELKY